MSLPMHYKRLAIALKNEFMSGERADHTHCRHGVYVGDAWGPDYMCGSCESGESDYAIALGLAYQERRRDRLSIAREVKDVISLRSAPGEASLADVLDPAEHSVLAMVAFHLGGDLRRGLTLRDAVVGVLDALDGKVAS